MKIIESRLSFLDGFLQGISEIDGRIREFKILAWVMDYDNSKSFCDHFSEMLQPELTIQSFNQVKMDFKSLEFELINNILTNPLNLNVNDLERKRYIAFRILDYIADSIEGLNYKTLEVFDLNIKFNEGGANRYFIFPVGEKAMFILFRAPNEIL